LLVPGWHATVNGEERPIIRVNGVFRGLQITAAGNYDVMFWYRPRWWNVSLGFVVLAILVLGWRSLRLRRRSPAT
jgi:uncharacterized membrane protein YfhO